LLITTRALRRAAASAEEHSRMKTQFLANMSHEIRTPMNGIIGFTELAQGCKDVSETTREYLRKIEISAQGLFSIINDILDISKIEAGKVDLERIPFSLHELFRYCETVTSVKAVEKGISLFIYSEPIVNRMLVGDPTKLRQILLNLLSNAVKFTNSGTVKLMVAVEHEGVDCVWIHFEIKDSGIGMSAEQIKKVFLPFEQADRSTTRRFGGTGLGLPITKSLIELMGGELQMESVLGIGSRFCFTLRFDFADERDTSYEREKNIMTGRSRPIFAGKILVCEDNEINQEVISTHLAYIGLTTIIAENGKCGVEEVMRSIEADAPFDLILMDIFMPEMDGLEASTILRAKGLKIPIVALSANVMTSDMDGYKSHGINAYLSKPFSAHELWDCLLKFLTPERMAHEPEQTPYTESGKSSVPALKENDDPIVFAVGLKLASGD
jgi:CheY-like chemotaxis protein